MELKQAGASLDSLISSFNDRISGIQELVIARNMYPATTISDLSAIDAAVKTLEYQMQAIKERVRGEMEAIPKAKKLIELSLRQQKKLEHMLAHLPSSLYDRASVSNDNTYRLIQEISKNNPPSEASHLEVEPAVSRKVRLGDSVKTLRSFCEVLGTNDLGREKKGKGPVPHWYITAEELDSLSSYMRGRLTLDKVNTAVNDMAAYADANAQLVGAPRNKLGKDVLEKALELRDIAMNEVVKGKHFFLEADMKGSVLKLDTTGKAILTVLRHLGRIHETRIGHHRVILLSKPQ